MRPPEEAQRIPPSLIVILVAALGARAGVAILTRSWVVPADRHFIAFGYEMGQIASALAGGYGFAWPPWTDWLWYEPGPTAWMPPLYPALMALVFEGFGIFSWSSAVVLMTLQTAASLLSGLLLFIIGRRLWGTRAGLLAALGLALYPASIHFSVQKFWSTSFFAACPLLLMLALERTAEQPRARIGLGLGVAFGLTALLDPVILAVVPFALGWLMWRAEGESRAIRRTLATALIGLFIALSPWLIRNYLVFGRVVPVKSNFGNELFVGNNPHSVGDHRDVGLTLRHYDELLTPAERAFIAEGHEVDRSALLMRKAWGYIVDDPLRFVMLSANRVLHYWTLPNPLGSMAERVSELCYLLALALGIVGIATSDLRRKLSQLGLLFLLAVPLPFYVTLVSHFRYRFVVEPLLILFGAAAVSRLWDRLGRRTGIWRHARSLLC